MRSSRNSGTRQLPPPDAGIERVITLDQIRPHPRIQNEYVDGPKVPVHGSLKPHIPGGSLSTTTSHRVALPVRANTVPHTVSSVRALNPNFGLITPISTQPTPLTTPLKKDLVEPAVTENDDEIICSKCGKCKCGSCTEPQALPSKWLCGDSCQVSPEAAIETCTCFCCVKGLFYHWGKDEQEGDSLCYMDPCACLGKPHCCKRWTCMGCMALCLPCLCCYWPARGALKACTLCYNKCRKKGCQCAKSNKPSKKISDFKSKNGSNSQCRGLLIESDSSSA
ncbi:hypothetical protein FSP39_007086 [Pinctada imbricata]|uniref:Sprouty n=1 Tax=Pinctada imbricata TaxID=66713 RepID=A0AA88Y810_PINIB|nr:hypothetical protein FSP39_007086 [Pinctada imbricata]